MLKKLHEIFSSFASTQINIQPSSCFCWLKWNAESLACRKKSRKPSTNTTQKFGVGKRTFHSCCSKDVFFFICKVSSLKSMKTSWHLPYRRKHAFFDRNFDAHTSGVFPQEWRKWVRSAHTRRNFRPKKANSVDNPQTYENTILWDFQYFLGCSQARKWPSCPVSLSPKAKEDFCKFHVFSIFTEQTQKKVTFVNHFPIGNADY